MTKHAAWVLSYSKAQSVPCTLTAGGIVVVRIDGTDARIEGWFSPVATPNAKF